jgi:hypothetical protein
MVEVARTATPFSASALWISTDVMFGFASSRERIRGSYSSNIDRERGFADFRADVPSAPFDGEGHVALALGLKITDPDLTFQSLGFVSTKHRVPRI